MHLHGSTFLATLSFYFTMSQFKNEKETAMHVEAGANDTNHTPKENPDPWYKQTQLRKLYISLGFLFLASSTLGYDGSLLNGLQTMNTWQMCKSTTLRPGLQVL